MCLHLLWPVLCNLRNLRIKLAGYVFLINSPNRRSSRRAP